MDRRSKKASNPFQENITKGFKESQRIEPLGFIDGLKQRFLNPKKHKILRKSMTQIEKELDLHKLVHRGRVILYQALGNLTNE